VKFADQDKDFYLEVHSATNPNNVYFRIDADSFIFGPTYLEMKAKVNNNKHIYGNGERVSPNLFLQEGIYTSWARDIPSPVEDGKPPGKNDYGVHPVLFGQAKFANESDNSFFAIYNHNAGAQDLRVKHNDDEFSTITYQILGTGIFDFFILLDNPNPEMTTLKYHKIIGVPLLPPFWAFGWHQCKYGYNSTQEMIDVYENYKKFNFPLDVLWSDIDYMDRWRDFTVATNLTF